MTRRSRGIVAVAGLGCLILVGIWSARKTQRQLEVAEVCQALADRQFDRVIQSDSTLVGNDEIGQMAAECRCTAMVASGDIDGCVSLVQQLALTGEEDAWIPAPAISVLAIGALRDRGDTTAAAALARRASLEYPQHGLLQFLELSTRSAVEGERSVVEEMASRLEARGGDLLRLRVLLASVFFKQGDMNRVLGVLGKASPPADSKIQNAWFRHRTRALAELDREEDFLATHERWRQLGGNPADVAANYATLMSDYGLDPGPGGWVPILRKALENEDQITDPEVHEHLYSRLVSHLVVDGRFEEAALALERGRRRFALAGVSVAEIQRSQLQKSLGMAGLKERHGGLRFQVHPQVPGAELLVSPDPSQPPDGPYERVSLNRAGEGALRRAMDIAPQRWVYRHPKGGVLASGAVWVGQDQIKRVEVSPSVRAVARLKAGEPPLQSTWSFARQPGDGHPRVFVVVLDCGDWRIIQYLRQRGELPVFDTLAARGWRAVLDSNPAFTAAAMKAMVYPGKKERFTVLHAIHEMGVEMMAFSPTHRNPFAAVGWLIPDEVDLFRFVGSGAHVSANLLFSQGQVKAARHAEVVGPRGAQQPPLLLKAYRPLSAVERTAADLGVMQEKSRESWLEESASLLDGAITIAQAGEIDFLMLRIARLDLFTHGHYVEVSQDGQDDGDRLLYHVYRYLDRRIGELAQALDEDDYLIVMSDHGIRTSMEHDRPAVFVVTGGKTPSGRAEGRPHIRGVSRVLVGLLGLATDWPETGVAPWATGKSTPLPLGSSAPVAP